MLRCKRDRIAITEHNNSVYVAAEKSDRDSLASVQSLAALHQNEIHHPTYATRKHAHSL